MPLEFWLQKVLPVGLWMAIASLNPDSVLAQDRESSLSIPQDTTSQKQLDDEPGDKNIGWVEESANGDRSNLSTLPMPTLLTQAQLNTTPNTPNAPNTPNTQAIQDPQDRQAIDRVDRILAQIDEASVPVGMPTEVVDGAGNTENADAAQVTSVSQLSDVRPTDWAYQAMAQLIERYGCIAGYPDSTFRGNRAITRYEFAAGFNACLEQLAQGIGSNPEDLESLRRLLQDFSAELATLRGRVDQLEARTTALEENQFSTTTRLFGQAIVGVQGRFANTADFFPVDGIRDTEDPATQINLITNYQLSLVTQFSPSSLLLVGLQAGDGTTTPRLSNDSRLAYEGDTNNRLVLSDLTYRQLIGDNLALIVGTAGVNGVNVFRGANRIEGAGSGPLSSFAQRNPIVSIGAGRGGVGLDWQVAPRISFQAVYSTSLPDNPSTGGLFGSRDGDTTIGTQLTLAPTDDIDVTLNYINSYSPSGSLRTGVGDDQLTAGDSINTNAFGATLSWRISPRITVGTWGGFTTSRIPGDSGSVETTNWMVFANFPDLFGEGNMGGIYVGQPPKIVSSDLPVGQNVPDRLAGGLGAPGDQPGTTTHVELFYRYQLSDNISITPGVIVVFDPGHTPASDTVVIGAIRTTFRF